MEETKKEALKMKALQYAVENLKNYPKDKFVRVILKLCKSKKELTYYENKYLFQYGVLEDSTKWINDNIQGRFFTKDLMG